ncbi:GNAT family N-acetyltransferase [Acuticoccus sp. MNP-M23]|uniref:GNAT family N-acetyltransferase n=1 Tax=Acuticoccus sp. MNP-M23 TaxID=3072793 RepID=UPI0028156644|nr:GNAT family N-acetyltransferase [Acuticoccus sp. MNP-M23]WMS40884.1 GNAT family N-acetyltransferase [Acuticoccus sp. MNP-M23]
MAAAEDGAPARVVDAERADAVAIAALLTASITDLCEADHGHDPAVVASWTANKTPQTVLKWIEDPELGVLAGWENGEIVSVGAFRVEGIMLTYVAPAHVRRGHGSALLAVMEACLGFAGVQNAHVTATRTALGFYEACGYIADGPPDGGPGNWGQPMIKDLSA